MSVPVTGEPYVFLSYASADRERALAIADALEAAGVGVWLDQRNIAGGSSWNASIVRGIKGCGALILAATGAAVASHNVERELQLAVEFDRPVLPVVLEPVAFPDAMRYALAGVQWVDVLDRPTDEWLGDVLRALAGLGFAGSDAAPTPPPVPSSAPITPAPPVLTNLPAALTSFVGREQEIGDIMRLLATARLVTLTGPGGTGKTRLALAVAERVQDRYRDGSWFVDLAPLTDPTLVATSITQALGVREGGGRSPGETLTASLREKRTLLVLDNFEQVVEAAPLLRDLLAGAAGLTLLVTSRVVLHVSGEHEYAVPPLPLPLPHPEAAQVPSPDDLAANPAVALFAHRARAVKGDFALTLENAGVVAEICARLDGLPLAIELAAARIRLLSPDAIRARLDERLKLLTGGARDLPARQQTLRGAIQWSFDLLDEEEQRLFRCLAVFAGACTPVAAEAVCTVDGDPNVDVFDRLGSLTEKSLLRQDDGGEGEPRFAMLATIREFGLDQLSATGDADTVRRAHAAFFLRLAEGTAPQLNGPDQVRWFDRLEREHDNLRAALGWLLAAGEEESTLRLAGALWWFWWVRGFWNEGVSWLDRALAMGGAGGDPAARALALEGAGYLRSNLGGHDLAVRLLDEAVALHRQLGDPRGISRALSRSGAVLYRAADFERSAATNAEALKLHRDLGDEHGAAWSLSRLGSVALGRGDDAAATTLFEAALPVLRQAGDDFAIGFALTFLAQAAFAQGDLGRAEARLREALLSTTRLRSPMVVGNLYLAAALAATRGEIGRAVRLFGTGDARAERQGGWFLPNEDRYLCKAARLRDARASLGDEAYAAAYEEGSALSLDAAVALALAQSEEPTATP